MSSLLFVFAVSMLCIVTGFPSDRFRKDVTYSKCENTYDQCNEWKLNGLCNMNNYKEYMTMQCPVACGLCQRGETFMSRSNIATPDSEESEESESESGSGSAEESNENDQSDASTEKEEAKEQQTSTTETQVPHKAPEEDEKAEKYEDSEEEDNDESLQATKDSEKDYKKANQNKDTSSEKQNLLGKLVDSGKLKAYAVKKEKSHEVKEEENTQGDERSLSAADIVQGISSSGSGESGSGEEPNSLQVILKQSYDSKYGNVNTPAFQILAGNFENDVEEALGGDSEVSDIAFSEAEIEGNPRVIGKVKVTFKFKGDYQKLQKLVDTGNINGMLVVKNSLEGSIFNH